MPLRNGHFRELVIQTVDFLYLAQQPPRIEAVRHGHAPAMIGERHILITARADRRGHGFDVLGPIRPVGMDMEVAADVRGDQEAGQLVSFCQCDFPAVLAQFRWDE